MPKLSRRHSTHVIAQHIIINASTTLQQRPQPAGRTRSYSSTLARLCHHDTILTDLVSCVLFADLHLILCIKEVRRLELGQPAWAQVKARAGG